MNRVAIVGGCRTPFVRAGGAFAKHSFLDLGAHAVRELVKRLELDPEGIDELVYSTVLLDPRAPNFARETLFRAGLPATVSAHSVSNNCISGLVSLTMLADGIKVGRIKVGIGGGSESMSRPTLTLSHRAEAFFLKLARARSLGDRLKVISGFKFGFIMPQPPSPKEPSTGLTMGQHCELSAQEFNLAREGQDAWALRSHQMAAKAQQAGILADEIAAVGDVTKDNLIRADTTIEKLRKLGPVFDRGGKGTITAGNASSLTDGASAICLMAEGEARRQGREILGFLEAIEYAGINPADGLLMAPALALPKLLSRNGLKVSDVDRFEIHEAFAAQVLLNRQAWEQGWNKFPDVAAIGAIPDEKINLNGGSLAIGHPFAATGGRLVLSLCNELKRSKLKTGVISICAAGAMAGAALIRRE